MINQQALDLIKRFEGLRLKPYLCSAGVPTIGYGSTYYEDGSKVTLKDSSITKDRADELMKFTINHQFIPAVLRLCPVLIAHENKLGAIVSFTYNLGVGRLQSSTLRRKINAEQWDDAGEQLLRWNLANGKILKGLKLRREAEKALFLS